jgi:hypothetical protein
MGHFNYSKTVLNKYGKQTSVSGAIFVVLVQSFTPSPKSPPRYHYPEHDQRTTNRATNLEHLVLPGSPKFHPKFEVRYDMGDRLVPQAAKV